MGMLRRVPGVSGRVSVESAFFAAPLQGWRPMLCFASFPRFMEGAGGGASAAPHA